MNDTKLITPKELFSLMNKDNPGNIGLMKVYELVRRKDFPALFLYWIEKKAPICAEIQTGANLLLAFL